MPAVAAQKYRHPHCTCWCNSDTISHRSPLSIHGGNELRALARLEARSATGCLQPPSLSLLSRRVDSMKLRCYALQPDPPQIRPAPITRAWMDRIPNHHAYRCLPLGIANSHGWKSSTLRIQRRVDRRHPCARLKAQCSRRPSAPFACCVVSFCVRHRHFSLGVSLPHRAGMGLVCFGVPQCCEGWNRSALGHNRN